MASDRLFDRRDRHLSSSSEGAVDLGCPIPSPALLLSTGILSDTWWKHLGGKQPWKTRWEACPQDVKDEARSNVEHVLAHATTRMETILMWAESTQLCALMDAMHAVDVNFLDTISTEDLDKKVAIDTPLAEGLAVRKENAPSAPCHQVVVSSLHHEIKSIAGCPVSGVFCYPRVGPVHYKCVAVGGVCLRITPALVDDFQPHVPGKLVIYEAEWVGPRAAILCTIGAANTILVILFLTVTPTRYALTTQNAEYWFLAVNAAMEVLAVAVAWHLKHRWEMGWRRNLARLDPFHALLTTDRAEFTKVGCILGLEAVGGLASVVGIGFTTRSAPVVLLTVAVPLAVAASAKYNSSSLRYRTPLICAAVAFYLLEFVYEIIVFVRLEFSVLGLLVSLSCVAELLSLTWILATLLHALHFLNSTKGKQTFLGRRAPCRIRDGTLAAFRLPELPRGGLMSTSALGSVVLPGKFVHNGGSTIKEGTTSYKGYQRDGRPTIAGWLSLEKCSEASPFVKEEPSMSGTHAWLGDVVISCGLVIPILG